MNFLGATKKIFAKSYNKIKQGFRVIKFKRDKIKVAKGSYISTDVTIGRCTRINNASYISECDIGSFCAIGGRLVVRGSNHSINRINMQDWTQREIIGSKVKVSGYKKGRVKVGNGVWIGDSVIILPGGMVGDGAVVGAGSVVTKAIPPFAIAVGNPAKVIKYRFSQEIIDIIKDVKWWTWSYDQMRRFRPFFEIDLQSIRPEELKDFLKGMGTLESHDD